MITRDHPNHVVLSSNHVVSSFKSCRFVFQIMSFCLSNYVVSLILFKSCRSVFELMSFRCSNHVVRNDKITDSIDFAPFFPNALWVQCFDQSETAFHGPSFSYIGSRRHFLRTRFLQNHTFAPSFCVYRNVFWWGTSAQWWATIPV